MNFTGGPRATQYAIHSLHVASAAATSATSADTRLAAPPATILTIQTLEFEHRSKQLASTSSPKHRSKQLASKQLASKQSVSKRSLKSVKQHAGSKLAPPPYKRCARCVRK